MAKSDHIESSGNVFADLGHPQAGEMLAKAELAQKIARVLSERHFTQVEAAAILKVDQPKISALTRGRLSGFSIERLLRFLLLLGSDVAITINARPRYRAKVRVRTGQKSIGMGRLTVGENVAVKAPKSRTKP